METSKHSPSIVRTKRRTSVPSSKVPAPYHCEVCNVVTCDSIKCGVYACEACKKFFLRNRSNSSLQCVTGLNNCTFGDDNSKALVSASGKFWRMLCPKCRLAKCKAVGMRMVHKAADVEEVAANDSRSVNSVQTLRNFPSPDNRISPPKPLAIIDNPSTQQEHTISEDCLRSVVNAGRQLMMAFELLPLRNNNNLVKCDEIEAFKAGLGHFDCIVQVLKEFVAQIPGYSSTAVEDRCTLFAYATPTITLAATNKRAPTMCGLSPVNGAKFITFYPEFEYTIKESAHLWNALANWNPSPAEFSLLLSLLFYQASVGLPCYKTTSRIIAQFISALQAYLGQSFGGNFIYVENRVKQLGYLLSLMHEAGMRRNIAFAAIKQRCPHLFTLNRYLAEIHEKNKQGYSQSLTDKPSGQVTEGQPSEEQKSASV